MKKNAIPSLSRFKAQIVEMASLHLCAKHLPHIRKHGHYLNRSQPSKRAKVLAEPRLRLTLPLYIIDLSQSGTVANAKEYHQGWLYFVDWRRKLAGLATVRKTGNKTSLVSLLIGPTASIQHRVAMTFLARKITYKDLHCIEAPALHFRALSYSRKSDGRQFVVPLSSDMVRLRLGIGYRSRTAYMRLQSALEHRLECARKLAKSPSR